LRAARALIFIGLCLNAICWPRIWPLAAEKPFSVSEAAGPSAAVLGAPLSWSGRIICAALGYPCFGVALALSVAHYPLIGSANTPKRLFLLKRSEIANAWRWRTLAAGKRGDSG
jgi:hypothetical protein